MIITEEVISRLAEDLHHLSLIDYVATQDSGKSAEYEVRWGGRNVGMSSRGITAILYH